MAASKLSHHPLWRTSEDFIGKAYGRLTIIKLSGPERRTESLVECSCLCGALKIAKICNLTCGDTKSCGCLLRETLALPTPERAPAYGARKRLVFDAKKKRESQELWKSKNKDKVSATSKRFRQCNRAQVKAEKAAYYQREKRAIIEKKKERYASDENYRILELLRSRTRKTIRASGGKKSARCMTLLGCTFDHLKAHLVSLFTDGMTWEALMRGEIHIDHKRPCALFDLRDAAQQRACFHWTNLQPLWAFDNLSKGARVEDVLAA